MGVLIDFETRQTVKRDDGEDFRIFNDGYSHSIFREIDLNIYLSSWFIHMSSVLLKVGTEEQKIGFVAAMIIVNDLCLKVFSDFSDFSKEHA